MVSSHSYSNNGLMKDKEMLQIIEQELKKPAVAGSVWQVISADWFNKWKSFVEFSGNQSSELSEEYIQAELGKIDNSKLESPYTGELKSGLTEGVDFILLPDDAAAFLFRRYGGGPHFQRDCINLGTKAIPRLIISLYRVRIESIHCTLQTNSDVSSTLSPNTNDGKNKWNIHFLPRHTSFKDAMDVLAVHYKVSVALSSKTRYWIKLSDEEGSTVSKPRKSKLARILSVETTDVTDDNWKFLRYPVNENLGTLLGNKECIQVIVETTIFRTPHDSDWPRATILGSWRNKIEVGDIIDARDKYHKWYAADVLEVDDVSESIVVHFKGWGSSFNEKIKKVDFDARIKPAFSETFDRFRWKVGDTVELKVFEGNMSTIESEISNPVWLPVKVTAVDLIQDRIQVSFMMESKIKAVASHAKLPAAKSITCDDEKKSLKISSSEQSTSSPADVGEQFQWVDILGDDVCPHYTHTKADKVSETALTVTNHKDNFASSMSVILSKPPTTPYTSPYNRYDYYGDKNIQGVPPCAGVVGLCNIGNTCFMNSILQCLSNTQAITTIFTSESYKEDINSDNPLGHGGKLAKVYAQLIQDIWSGSYVKIYPREFKTTIGDFQPQFAGYEQQDSQELMNFLLDGLHEDLNRVVEKPHVTKIESKGRSDSLIASESWRRYLLRNDSSLVDRCFAQLKSHVTCVNCGNESVTFDEYSSVSLPLPIKNTRIVTVLVRLLPLSSTPCKIDLEVELTDPMDQLKRILVNKLLSLKLMDLSTLQMAGSSKVSESSEEYEMVSHSDASMSPPCIVDTEDSKSVGPSEKKKPPSPSTELTDSILKNIHFHFGCLFANRTTSVFKTYDADSSANKSGAVHAFVGRHDTLMAFQLEHEAPIAKVAYYSYYNSYNTTPQKPSTTFSVDICVSKKEKSTYANFETSRLELFGYPIRVSFPTTATNTDVLQKVSEIARRYFREDSPFCVDYESKPLTDRPYEVAVCNAYSGYISRRIPADDEIFTPLLSNDTLSIAWTSVGIETHFDEQQVSEFRVFASSSQVNVMGETVPARRLTIYDCIDKFIEREQLASTETMYCSNCKEHLAPIKKFDLWSTPDILILHLKRFQYVPGQYFVHREKISEVIDFPIVGLDLSRYVIGQASGDAPPIYDLYAVSNHMGGLGGGHYTATCKNFINNTWYDFNDSSVTETNAADAVSGYAYVLFYQRRKGQMKWGGVVPTKEPISDT